MIGAPIGFTTVRCPRCRHAKTLFVFGQWAGYNDGLCYCNKCESEFAFKRQGKTFATAELGKFSWVSKGSKLLKNPTNREPIALGGHYELPSRSFVSGFVAWVDPDGNRHSEVVRTGDLKWNGAQLAKQLLDGGAQIPLDEVARRRLFRFLLVDLELQAEKLALDQAKADA